MEEYNKKTVRKWIRRGIGWLLVIVLLFSFIGMFTDYGFAWYGVFKTKTVEKAQKDAEREVFEQTQSYVEGKRQELIKLRFEYETATDSIEKLALRRMAVHQTANIKDLSVFDQDMQFWIKKMRGY